MFKRISFLLVISFFLSNCSSTGVKDLSSLSLDESDSANIYFKRQSGFLYMGVRANVYVDGIKQGSMYPKEYIKFNLSEGVHYITIKADPISGVIGKTVISENFEKGQNYYFIVGVNKDNVAGAVLGGVIGSAIVGGPFPSQQVNKETFYLIN